MIDPGALAAMPTSTASASRRSSRRCSKDTGVRLPGARRKALADKAAIEGVEIPQGLLGELRALAGQDPRQ